MRLSISNLGWEFNNNEKVFSIMEKYGFSGLELVPTKIFKDKPYYHIEEALDWALKIKETYGIKIASMQSICYGRTENIFNSPNERLILKKYLEKAIDFAEALSCPNLVFGCPKNRNINNNITQDNAIKIAEVFFREIAEYAQDHNTTVSIEPNPIIYGNNFITDVSSAIQLIKKVNSTGFKLNLDIGAMVYNQETDNVIKGNVQYINHVHLSEPKLLPINKRLIHRKIKEILKVEKYEGYISVEISEQKDLHLIEDTLIYAQEVYSG